jgi:hypothetical protein
MKESEILKSITEYLSYQKDLYFFRAGSGAFKTEQGRYFKTGKKGCPDVIVCIKGLFVGLEVKNEKNKQSIFQKQAQIDIENAVGIYEVVRSIADVEKLLETIRQF